MKVCSCPLSLPVVEPEEISQIGSEKEADDSAFRAGKHISYSVHQHINLELHIHLRLCLIFAGEPWARDLIFRTSLSIKWGNVTVSLRRRLNETLYFQVKCLAGASCYLPRHKESVGEIQRGKLNSKNDTTYKIRFEIAWCTAIEWAQFHMGFGVPVWAPVSPSCVTYTQDSSPSGLQVSSTKNWRHQSMICKVPSGTHILWFCRVGHKIHDCACQSVSASIYRKHSYYFKDKNWDFLNKLNCPPLPKFSYVEVLTPVKWLYLVIWPMKR